MSATGMRISALAAAYRGGRTTPSAVAARAHAAAVGPAWISVVERDTLAARAAELELCGPRGLPLFGIPFAVKDSIDVAGLPTTAACPSFAYRPARSAAVVERLLAAGAMLVGKTNMDQFATGLAGTRTPYGACSSVFDDRYVSGGSSSGSAVAVALRAVSFALGTDTAGSGRVPAALNGIVGLKPTRGLVSTDGVVPACRSLDCVSVFAADADGARRVLAVAASGVRPAPPAPRPVRVAVPRLADLDLDAPARAAFVPVLDDVATVADEVVEVDVSPLLEAAPLLYEGPWVAERHAAFGHALDAPDADPVVAAIVRAGARFTAADVFAAQERLAALAARAAGVWAAADALVLPTVPTAFTHADVAADPIGTSTRLGTFTNFTNLLDLAGVAIPAGMRSDGMPFGVTVLGPAGSDAFLLDLTARWPAPPGALDVAVCGSHLSGEPLNPVLVALGAALVETTVTAPAYRLVELPGGPPRRPGLVRVAEGGAAVEVEVWRMTAEAAGRLLATVPAPLAIGTVELRGGREVRGFVCEGHAADGALDITAHGGWRAYLRAPAVV